MDLGDDTADVSGDVFLGLDDVFDDAAFENETCGICMDVVIDRGVLDCCSHWFCFACVDNWATITNLCPMCKKEFQLITCLPVYDTIGNVKVDEHLLSRDNDWLIQGKNNTLSFPSYYINEDAVICLDGDGCKIRNKLSTEEDLNLDTSIACDSCDIWYHAFCVGFDPEQTLENSWLCPRCIDNKSLQEVDDISERKSGNHPDARNSGSGQSVDSTFSGKVSISVADSGETAIVVSMVEGNQPIRSTESDQVESVLDKETGIEMETLVANVDTCGTQFEQCSYRSFFYDGDDRILTGNIGAGKVPAELPLGLSSERTIVSSDNSVPENLFGSSSLDALSKGSAIHHDGGLGTSLAPSTSEVGMAVCDVFEDQAVGDSARHSNEVFSLSVNTLIKNDDEDVAPVDHTDLEVNSSMRNHTEILRSPLVKDAYTSDRLKKRERDSQAVTEDCAKREAFHTVPQRRRIETCSAIDPRGCFATTSTPEDSVLKHASGKEDYTSDIMSIVQEKNCKSTNRQLSGKRVSEKFTNDRPSGVGIRVKKIMRRVEDDKESSLLVQKLQNEIRESVGNKDLSDFSKVGVFDGKLLSAFRAVIAGTRDEPVNKVDPTVVRGKKSLLQKGKVRENLTKKIYGTASGRRRRAWDRDWEVEFWKHRCSSGKPGKVKTLQSVLDVLKKIKSSPVNDEMGHGPEREAANSILSRVYLADASVLPRKEDIKPLSDITGHLMVGTLKQPKQDKFSPLPDKTLSTKAVGTAGEISSSSSWGAVTSCDKGVMIDNSSFKVETSCRKEPSSGLKMGGKSYISASRNSIEGEKLLKDPLANPDSSRSDKRKWALEVLARKNALSNRDASWRKEENNPQLKENYPLLAQLPLEMRPVPVPGRHSKVPMPVRQAQLYRLTEHYLRSANVPIICRTADVELAVADAVNIEKEIFERSKSKLVYINLCSQHMMLGKPQTMETVDLTSSAQGTEQASNEKSPNELTTYPASGPDSVDEALRQAGLLSDSPPNSPQSIKSLDEEGNLIVERGKDFENLLDIDPHPDLDIYGDFDYDLDDEDYGGHSNVSSRQGESKLQNEDGDLKMKVVLSTVSCKRLISSFNPKDDEMKVCSSVKEQVANYLDKPRTVETDSCALPMHQHDKDVCQSMLKNTNDVSYPVTEPLEGNIYEVPSRQECEELYGPDKECLEERVYEEAMEATAGSTTLASNKNDILKNETIVSLGEHENYGGNLLAESRLPDNHESSERENSPSHSLQTEHNPTEQLSTSISGKKLSDLSNSVLKKVEAYVKEHIRPLCKGGIITVEQYRWAVGKATEKVMKYHSKARNANFLIKEGDKVKKLAEEYVEASQRKEWKLKLHS